MTDIKKSPFVPLSKEKSMTFRTRMGKPGSPLPDLENRLET